MKKLITIAMAGCLAVSLAACGGSSSTTAASTATSTASSAASSEAASSEAAAPEAAAENGEGTTLTGEADGFGGTITATVTMDGDTITAVTFDAPDETPEVGGAALDTLSEEIVAANGTDIDTVSGATFTSQGCIDAVQAALDSQN